MISAKIIADSKNKFGNRITTFVLTFPRFILAELNTHRMFSRNSASSRAIPFKKMCSMVINNPFIPIAWMKEHKGMQGNEYITDEEDIQSLTNDWLTARDYAVSRANCLNILGLTKQMCNRLLEPFMWHTAIVTATEFENFFALRAHEAAEIHFQALANAMLDAYNSSEPRLLNDNEWHIPFGDIIDDSRLLSELLDYFDDEDAFKQDKEKARIKIATARCARVSYLNFEGKDDYLADVTLHDSLLQAGHMSPFEHCAKADHIASPQRSGNFIGFTQYRKTLRGENKSDSRIIK